MKIINHSDKAKNGTMMFTDIIEFEFPAHPLRFSHSVDIDLNQVCGWVANTFSENYVVMEILNRRISGGWGENSKEQWLEFGSAVDRAEYPYPSHYELRCYDKDATLFLLRWS